MALINLTAERCYMHNVGWKVHDRRYSVIELEGLVVPFTTSLVSLSLPLPNQVRMYNLSFTTKWHDLTISLFEIKTIMMMMVKSLLSSLSRWCSSLLLLQNQNKEARRSEPFPCLDCPQLVCQLETANKQQYGAYSAMSHFFSKL